MRLTLAILLLTAYPAVATAQGSGQPSAGTQTQVDDRPPRVAAGVQAAQRRDVGFVMPQRPDVAVVAVAYGWPYHDFGRNYTHFASRYRDYARDYGDFASDYRSFAPRYRDYASDYGNFAYDYASESSGEPYRVPDTTGSLALDLLPTSAQVYVDDRYVGMVYELVGGLTLDTGSHRLEFRADGYEASAVDVTIEPGREISYRGTLVSHEVDPDPQPPVRADVTRPAMTVYFIPGCYLGNVVPTAARLPAGCDVLNVQVITPR